MTLEFEFVIVSYFAPIIITDNNSQLYWMSNEESFHPVSDEYSSKLSFSRDCKRPIYQESGKKQQF